ncbi:Dermonecrotic toxin LspiSicTox-betaIE1ii [Halotydeus destructor]|nr:Dermonecrotic toxin LspiSicTox-betaIE1ii [Halotydeus destructor]
MTDKFHVVIFYAAILSLVTIALAEDLRRPFYNIAHMVNSIDQIDRYLRLGANAIETDITFADNGQAVSTFHGFPCDCLRNCNKKEDINDFLLHLASLINPGSEKFEPGLALIVLDIKSKKLDKKALKTAAIDMVQRLSSTILKEPTKFKIIFSMEEARAVIFLEQLYIELASKEMWRQWDQIGYDIGVFNQINEIDDIFKTYPFLTQAWQSVGITNCLSYSKSDIKINQALAYRNDGKFPRKVYAWTYDIPHDQRRLIRLGVDGMITNRPDILTSVLTSKEFAGTIRLATLADDPFEQFKVTKSPKPGLIKTKMNLIGDTLKKVGLTVKNFRNIF